MGRGSYGKGIVYRSKGRAGTEFRYASHLREVVRQVSVDEIKKTKNYGRWKKAAEVLSVPWEERVAKLPNYVRPPGYEPGVRRIPLMPITPAEGQGRRKSL